MESTMEGRIVVISSLGVIGKWSDGFLENPRVMGEELGVIGNREVYIPTFTKLPGDLNILKIEDCTEWSEADTIEALYYEAAIQGGK